MRAAKPIHEDKICHAVYFCRLYDQLSPGDDYTRIKRVRQIGFLDFTLFPEAPEFYATYKMLNEKTHALYSSKFVLSVVSLSRLDLENEEDKQYHIDYWASLFKATTWEEIKMLTKQNEYIKEASTTIYQLSQEEAIRQQCEAREDYYRRQRTYRPTTGRSQNRSKVEQRIERTTARQREKRQMLAIAAHPPLFHSSRT